MSFAVVKFISENSDTDEEIVSEIPISWLTKNNTFCKWPPEKYCSLYISRSFPPEENWIEYPVAVEYICDTLTEAKQKAKGNIEVEDVGRGCRTIKPLEYFSPAEEEEKARGQRKKEGKTVSKKDNPNSTERNYHADFMTFLNREANSEETNPIINEDSGSDSLSEQDQTSNLDLQPAVAINNIQLKDDDRRRGGITLSRYQELYAEFLGNPEETPAMYLFGPLSEFFYSDDFVHLDNV